MDEVIRGLIEKNFPFVRNISNFKMKLLMMSELRYLPMRLPSRRFPMRLKRMLKRLVLDTSQLGVLSNSS